MSAAEMLEIADGGSCAANCSTTGRSCGARWGMAASRGPVTDGHGCRARARPRGARPATGGVPGAHGAVPPRAPGALLPDPRLGAGRRGLAAGDVAGGLARPRRVRGARVAADVAVPDRDQPLPERAARPRAPAPETPVRPIGGPVARARPPRRAELAGAVPRGPARELPDARPGRKRATRSGRRCRWRSSPPCSSCRRGSGRCWCCGTCSASEPPRSATMLDTTEAPSTSALKRARATLEARAARPRERAAAGLAAGARDRRAVRQGLRVRRRRRDRRAADRRRLADDAADAAGVPGPRGDRGLPRHRARGGRPIVRISHARERPARVRLLPARPRRRSCTPTG